MSLLELHPIIPCVNEASISLRVLFKTVASWLDPTDITEQENMSVSSLLEDGDSAAIASLAASVVREGAPAVVCVESDAEASFRAVSGADPNAVVSAIKLWAVSVAFYTSPSAASLAALSVASAMNSNSRNLKVQSAGVAAAVRLADVCLVGNDEKSVLFGTVASAMKSHGKCRVLFAKSARALTKLMGCVGDRFSADAVAAVETAVAVSRKHHTLDAECARLVSGLLDAYVSPSGAAVRSVKTFEELARATRATGDSVEARKMARNVLALKSTGDVEAFAASAALAILEDPRGVETVRVAVEELVLFGLPASSRAKITGALEKVSTCGSSLDVRLGACRLMRVGEISTCCCSSSFAVTAVGALRAALAPGRTSDLMEVAEYIIAHYENDRCGALVLARLGAAEELASALGSEWSLDKKAVPLALGVAMIVLLASRSQPHRTHEEAALSVFRHASSAFPSSPDIQFGACAAFTASLYARNADERRSLCASVFGGTPSYGMELIRRASRSFATRGARWMKSDEDPLSDVLLAYASFGFEYVEEPRRGLDAVHEAIRLHPRKTHLLGCAGSAVAVATSDVVLNGVDVNILEYVESMTLCLQHIPTAELVANFLMFLVDSASTDTRLVGADHLEAAAAAALRFPNNKRIRKAKVRALRSPRSRRVC